MSAIRSSEIVEIDVYDTQIANIFIYKYKGTTGPVMKIIKVENN